MKRLISFTMVFVMLFGMTAYAKNDESVKKFKVKANGEKIAFEVETEEHELDCMHKAKPTVKMTFEEGFRGDDEKLYFRLRWETTTMSEPDIDDYYIRPQIFSFALADFAEETERSFRLELPKYKYPEETTYSLWLVGGDDYKDNFMDGREDLLLVDEFVVFRGPEEEKPAEPLKTEVLLTVGKETIQYNDIEKSILEPVIFNDTGRLMIAAKDIAMVMEGEQKAGNSLHWDKMSRTVTLQIGEKTLSISEGSRTWLVHGEEVHAETASEIRNGILYVPLREVAKVFGYTNLLWDGNAQTVLLMKEEI